MLQQGKFMSYPNKLEDFLDLLQFVFEVKKLQSGTPARNLAPFDIRISSIQKQFSTNSYPSLWYIPIDRKDQYQKPLQLN
jgi:hypothetical protein